MTVRKLQKNWRVILKGQASTDTKRLEINCFSNKSTKSLLFTNAKSLPTGQMAK